MDKTTNNLLSLDEVISYFEYKVGMVALLSAIRKKQIEVVQRDGVMYIPQESLEAVYGNPYNNEKRIPNYFLTPKEVLCFFEGELSETALYKMLWKGEIKEKRVGVKHLIIREELEKQFNKKFKSKEK